MSYIGIKKRTTVRPIPQAVPKPAAVPERIAVPNWPSPVAVPVEQPQPQKVGAS